jgi:hypothetical protein
MVTSPPAFDARDLNVRDSLTTISVSSCYNYEDPDTGVSGVCECDNFDGQLPLTTMTMAGNSTSVGCAAYSTFVTIATSENPYPFTVTSNNGATVAVSCCLPLQMSLEKELTRMP